MFYHVIVKSKSDDSCGECKADLSKDTLVSRFIEPYEKGAPIVVNGRTIQPDDLERIKVSESEEGINLFISQLKIEDQHSSFAVIGGPSYTCRAIGRALDVTDEFIEGPVGYKRSRASVDLKKDPGSRSKERVFIVHGHDESAQNKAARFVEKLGFEAIILHERASSGRTIVEKIEHYSDVGFAIVLYTPDDEGRVKSEAGELHGRARQNVVFEHGYLIGKLGRRNVAALVRGSMELPNDVSGVIYIEIDPGASWQLQLAKEMKHSGFDIDMNKII